MEAKTMEKLKHMICTELDEIGSKKTLSPADVEQLYKMTDIVKNLDKIEMLEEGFSDDGYSKTGKWEADMRGEYGHDYSGRRHRDSRGRYASDGHSYHYPMDYSRESGKMMHLLDEMMDTASTERERDMIRKWKAEMH